MISSIVRWKILMDQIIGTYIVTMVTKNKKKRAGRWQTLQNRNH
jgi:hypothetical protein